VKRKRATAMSKASALTLLLTLVVAGCGSDSSSARSAAPVPVCSKPGPAMGVASGGLYVFNSGPGNAAPQILEYSTSLSSGATVKSGSVATGEGLTNLVFTHNGAWAYGLDANGNVWGYRVDPAGSGRLTSLGIVASGLPALSFSTKLILYRSGMLWVVDVTGSLNPMTTIHEYPINANGTLAPATTLTLTGFGLTPFVPPNSAPSNMVPTAVWLYQQSGMTVTLSVYPVNGSGTISGIAIQTLATGAFLGVARGPATFAYGSSGPAGRLVTFTTAHDGTLTPVSDVPLPPHLVGGLVLRRHRP
jgi:hypothetical protein